MKTSPLMLQQLFSSLYSEICLYLCIASISTPHSGFHHTQHWMLWIAGNSHLWNNDWLNATPFPKGFSKIERWYIFSMVIFCSIDRTVIHLHKFSVISLSEAYEESVISKILLLQMFPCQVKQLRLWDKNLQKAWSSRLTELFYTELFYTETFQSSRMNPFYSV